MTDLEMTRLCAEAMGYSDVRKKGDHVHERRLGKTMPGIYWPIDDDAQAMALVKKFQADICWGADEPNGILGNWYCDIGPNTVSSYKTSNSNLNRAICECVAKMQAAKDKP